MSESAVTGDGFDVDVLVIGAGPVGLTTAHVLGSYGIDTALVEPRLEAASGSPRCKQLNPRTMEIFRTLGLADIVRAQRRPSIRVVRHRNVSPA